MLNPQGKKLFASDSSMELLGASLDQDMLRELFTMDIKGFIPLSSKYYHWRYMSNELIGYKFGPVGKYN